MGKFSYGIKRWTKLKLQLEKPVLTKAQILPDPYDPKDYIKSVSKVEIPDEFTLENYAPRAPDQGRVGSCGPWSFRNFLYTISNRIGHILDLAPLDLYYRTRKLMGRENEDSGVHLRLMFSVAKKFGVIPWEFYPEKNNWKRVPPDFPSEQRFRIHSYERVPNGDLDTIKKVLSYEKLPIVIGVFIPYEVNYSFKFSHFGEIKNPKREKPNHKDYGHAITLVGYDEDWFYALNSWGPNHGRHGYLKLHKDFLKNKNFVIDQWTLSKDHF